MRLNRKILATCAALYLFSQLLFLINIQFPRGYNFDEFHYVPSAKQYLQLKENQNWEHPPLGKVIMAAGIAIGGDRPIGWRLMSTVFGSLTLVGMYLWALALFKDERTALWVALITLANQLLYVQARIGMLDTFMFAFVVWGLAVFSAAWDPENHPEHVRGRMSFVGLMMGLAIACKWAAVVPWAICVGLVLLVRLLQYGHAYFGKSSPNSWYHSKLWPGMKFADWVLVLGVVPAVAYFLTFIPLFLSEGPNHKIWNFFAIQKQMYEGQLRVVTSHPYMSKFTDWPLLKRPIWYAFDKEVGGPPDYVRGVLLLGNPLIMWTGLVALVGCLWGWLARKQRDAFLIVAFFAGFYLSWWVIPRKVAFYYYYYPAGMVLSLALGYVFHHGEKGPLFEVKWGRWTFLAASVGIFIYFFPILAALKIPADSFRSWMWFSTWI